MGMEAESLLILTSTRLALWMTRKIPERKHLLQATATAIQAISLFKQIGDKFGEAVATQDLVVALMFQRRTTEAKTHGEVALATFRALGDWNGEAVTLLVLAQTYLLAGEKVTAEEFVNMACTLFAENGNQSESNSCSQMLGRMQAYAAVVDESGAGRAAPPVDALVWTLMAGDIHMPNAVFDQLESKRVLRVTRRHGQTELWSTQSEGRCATSWVC